MAHILSGREIADAYEVSQKEKVASLVRRGVIPTLAIIKASSSLVIDTYIAVKKTYAEKIGCRALEYVAYEEGELLACISKLNQDDAVHGIIVQLPLIEGIDVERVLSSISIQKDVDGLHQMTSFVPPTVQAILKLMDVYVPKLKEQKVAIVGSGKLVGKPLRLALEKRGVDSWVFKKGDSLESLKEYRVIVSATGVPSLLTKEHFGDGAYIFDAGTAEQEGSVKGDVKETVYEDENVHITPKKGGIGMLTVRFLFENMIHACQKHFES